MGAIRGWFTGRSRAVAAVAAVAVVGAIGGGYQIYTQVGAGNRLSAARAAERDDPAAARRHLAACLATWPNDGEVNFRMARAARRDGDYPAAFRFLRRADEVGWEPSAIDLEKTLLRAQTGDFRLVEHRVLEWARQEPDDLHLFLEVLIPAYLRRPDPTLAHDLLTTWTRKQPDNPRALEWLKQVRERLGDAGQAGSAASNK